MDVRTGMLLDIKLSHELTHAYRAGASIDITSDDIEIMSGWGYCTQTAAQGNTNAENLAMLGASAEMIQDDDVMPDLAGNIVPLSLDTKMARRAGVNAEKR